METIDIDQVADAYLWKPLPGKVDRLFKQAIDLAARRHQPGDVYLNPETEDVTFDPQDGDDWYKVATLTVGDVGSGLKSVFTAPQKVMGGPNPVTSMIVGSLLGAGLGYGGGKLADWILPEEHFEKGRLPKVLAMLGAGAGTLPGLGWGAYANTQKFKDRGGGWFSGYPFRPQDYQKASRFSDVELPEANLDPEKRAYAPNNMLVENIPVDNFSGQLLGDMQPYGHTPPRVAASMAGLVQGASSLRRDSSWVSPFDIARTVVGLGARAAYGGGVGGLTGYGVGKALGLLAGLKPESQKKLQRSGTWAGALTSLMPKVFGL
jgi:hypothetical protein